jgi:hypothetical protein
VYAVALPASVTSPFSFTASFGASSSTWNCGRLYSSTLTCDPPGTSCCTPIHMRPVSRSRGATKVPEKEP